MADPTPPKEFGLLQMVESAMPSPSTTAKTALSPEVNSSKKLPLETRREFFGDAALRSLTSQMLPGFLKVLVMDGKAPMPEMPAEAAIIPENHPLALIGKLARIKSQLSEIFVDLRKEGFGGQFSAIENPQSRQKYIQRKMKNTADLYAEHTAVEQKLYDNRDAVNAFAEEHFDVIKAMPVFKYETPSLFSCVMPSSPGKIGDLERECMQWIPAEIEESVKGCAVSLEQARQFTGIKDPNKNPLEAGEQQIRSIQMLVNKYSQYRQQTLNDLRDFKMDVWLEKQSRPLEEMPDMAQQINSRMEKILPIYDTAIEMAKKIQKRSEEFYLFKNVGKVDVEWRTYSRQVCNEVSGLGYDPQKLIDSLKSEKEHLADTYKNAAKDTLMKWKIIEFLKDPDTNIDHSHSLFKITLAGGDTSQEEKQRKLDNLKEIIEELYPKRQLKTAKAMLFLDRTAPDSRRNFVKEFEDALEAIEKGKQSLERG